MSIPVVDKHSGAIIFQPTPEEIKIQELGRRVNALEKEIENLKSIVVKQTERGETHG